MVAPGPPRATGSADNRPAQGMPPQRPRPWRTEGLPDGQAAAPRPRWSTMAAWLVGYLLLFGLAHRPGSAVGTAGRPVHRVQGQVAGTERRGGVCPRRLDRRRAQEGRPACPDSRIARISSSPPSGRRSRPTICSRELSTGGATVRATPLVQQRGFLTNLLISFAPLLLLFGFYFWMFRRQQGAMGGLLGGGRQKRVDPETVRVTFDDVAGIDEVEAEINEVVDFLKDPEKYRRLGARAPEGRAADRGAGHRQDAARPRDRRRGQGAVLQRQRVRVHRDDRRRGASRVRELFAEARKVAPGHHLHRRDRHHRPGARRRARVRRPRRARADAEPDPDRDGRLLGPRGRGRAGRHQPAGRARSGAAPARPLRSTDRRAPAGPQGPRRDPAGPHAQGAARRRRRPRAARGRHARHDGRRPRQSGERGGAARRAPRAGRGAPARPDRRAGEGAARHGAQRRHPGGTSGAARRTTRPATRCSACSSPAPIRCARCRSFRAAARWA